MGECVSNKLYSSLAWCDGASTRPGIRRGVYFIPRRDIVVWPQLPILSAEQAMATAAVLTGDFTLAEGKTWHRLDILVAKSDVTSETQGEYPNFSSLNKATLFYGDTNEEATGFCRLAMQDDLIYLVQQQNGKFRLLGSENFGNTETKPSQKQGQGITATDMGTTLEIQCSDECPAPFYPGKIETEDGDISGKDGGAWSEE